MRCGGAGGKKVRSRAVWRHAFKGGGVDSGHRADIAGRRPPSARARQEGRPDGVDGILNPWIGRLRPRFSLELKRLRFWAYQGRFCFSPPFVPEAHCHSNACGSICFRFQS